MGTFSGSVHVRGSGYQVVRTALEAMAQQLKCRFFLAPEVDGWMTVSPDHSGQEARVSKELARRVSRTGSACDPARHRCFLLS